MWWSFVCSFHGACCPSTSSVKKTRHTKLFRFFFLLVGLIGISCFLPLGCVSCRHKWIWCRDYLDVKCCVELCHLIGFYLDFISQSISIFCVGAFLCPEFVKCWANVDTIVRVRVRSSCCTWHCQQQKGTQQEENKKRRDTTRWWCSTRVSSLVITFSHFLPPSKGFRVVAFITHIFQPPTDRLIVVGNDITCRPSHLFYCCHSYSIDTLLLLASVHTVLFVLVFNSGQLNLLCVCVCFLLLRDLLFFSFKKWPTDGSTFLRFKLGKNRTKSWPSHSVTLWQEEEWT